MIDLENRLPAPGKEGRIKLTYEDGHVEYAKLEMADEPAAEGTPWNRQTGRLLQADIREYPVAEGYSISAGDVVNISNGNIVKDIGIMQGQNSVSIDASILTSLYYRYPLGSNRLLVTSTPNPNKTCFILAYDELRKLKKEEYTYDFSFPTNPQEVDFFPDDTIAFLRWTTIGTDGYIYAVVAKINDAEKTITKVSEYTFVTLSGYSQINHVHNTAYHCAAAIGFNSGVRSYQIKKIYFSPTAGFSTEKEFNVGIPAGYNASIPAASALLNQKNLVLLGTYSTSTRKESLLIDVEAESISEWYMTNTENYFSSVQFGVVIRIDDNNVITLPSGSATSNNNIYFSIFSVKDGALQWHRYNFSFNFAKSRSFFALADGDISHVFAVSSYASQSETVSTFDIDIATYATQPTNLLTTVNSGGIKKMFPVDDAQFVGEYAAKFSMLQMESSGPQEYYLQNYASQAIALISGSAGDTISALFNGTTPLSGIAAGTEINSPGVYGYSPADGWLSVRPFWETFPLAGMCKIATGSYIGNGGYGQANARTIKFPFKPVVVFIVGTSGSIVIGATYGPWFYGAANGVTLTDSDARFLNLTWGDDSVSFWYNNEAKWMANVNGATYQWFVLGEIPENSSWGGVL